MANKRKKNASSTASPRIVNRKARYDYHIHETLEVGIALQGCEVKSIRNGQISLAEGYARVEPETIELFLYDVNIPEYAQADRSVPCDPQRRRKLLARKRQIKKLMVETSSKGATLIPLTMYFVRGMVKLEIGVATGKGHYDRRQDLKKQDANRDMRRMLSKRM